VPDRLFPMTKRLGELVRESLSGYDVLVGRVPEIMDGSPSPLRAGVVPSDPKGSAGQAHGTRTSTDSGVTTVPEFGWSVFFLAATVNPSDEEEAFRVACSLAGALLDGVEGRLLDSFCGPLELRTYLALEEGRPGVALWRQDWGCARMGWS